jgi:branched-subunit amino acid transport protein
MEFITAYNLTGVLIGICTFLVIGIFHPIVIKSEYYFGVRCWWVFLLAGVACFVAAWIIRDVFWASLSGVIACSSFWSIYELFQQRRRVRRGWFPRRPEKGQTYLKK